MMKDILDRLGAVITQEEVDELLRGLQRRGQIDLVVKGLERRDLLDHVVPRRSFLEARLTWEKKYVSQLKELIRTQIKAPKDVKVTVEMWGGHGDSIAESDAISVRAEINVAGLIATSAPINKDTVLSLIEKPGELAHHLIVQCNLGDMYNRYLRRTAGQHNRGYPTLFAREHIKWLWSIPIVQQTHGLTPDDILRFHSAFGGLEVEGVPRPI